MDATITYSKGDQTHILTSPQWHTYCGKDVEPGDVSALTANCTDCLDAFAREAARRTDWDHLSV